MEHRMKKKVGDEMETGLIQDEFTDDDFCCPRFLRR